MADNYLEFSETLTHLTNEQVNCLKLQLETVHVIDGVEYTEDKLPDTGDGGDTGDGAWIGCRAYRDMEDYDPGYDENVGFNYSFSEDVDEDRGRYLWIYSQEHGYVDRAAHLVQKFLREFRPDQYWSLTYADICSKPRVGEFGGGAVFVTATDIKYFNAWEFVEQQEKRHKGKFKGSKAGTDAESRRYILYDHDMGDLATTTVYASYDEAVDDASQLDNVIVLALPFVQEIAQEVTPVCECEQPGHFRSGVSGILARVENGRVVEGTKVERCDSCSRYPSDKATFEKLVKLGIASGEPEQDSTLPHAKRYVETGGGFCPNCQSHQTEGDSVDFDGQHCTQRMRCLECDAVWVDVYVLSSLSAVSSVSSAEPPED